MAGAESAVHRLLVQKPEVPERLVKGSKFLKWPKSDGDDSSIAVQVTLRVDSNGHVLYWQEPNKDTECLEISSIRDTRCGKYAREPKQEKLGRSLSADPQLSKMVSNASIPLSERCFTIVYGVKLIEQTFLNFIAVESNPQQVIKEWADFLLNLAYHPTTRHISVETSIEKAYTKLRLETNQFGEIPVKKLVKLLGGQQKRIENALVSVGFITGRKDKTIDADEFQLPGFKKLLQLCCPRPEMDSVYSSLATGARRVYISQQKVKDFVNTVQRDPKLNELLYPFINDDQAMDLVQKYEPNVMFAKKGQLTQEGFDAYLQSDDNLVVDIENYAEHQDMGLSLSHYFINSSHNTYLTGTQYRSKSSAEMYRQVLLTGCRCVELDCWDGDEEPIINHGFTLCTHVLFREVIEAINESAFKTSPYPVILSFENHVDNPQQQAKMAQYCRDIFKEKLLIDPSPSYPIEQGAMLPPPKELLYKIIVKNKKQRPVKEATSPKPPADESVKERQKRGSMQSESLPPASPQNGSSQRSHQRNVSSSSISSVNGKAASRTSSANFGTKKQPLSPLASTNSNSTCRQDMLDIEEDETNVRKPDSAPIMNGSMTDKTTELSLEKISDTTTTETETTSVKSETVTEQVNDDEKIENEIPKEDPRVNGDSVTEEDSAPKCDPVDESIDRSQLLENGETGENGDEPTKESKDEDDEDSEEEGAITNLDYEENAKECGTALRESIAYEAMSSLVNYIQPVRFKQFDISERRNRSYEISSFTESAALRLLTYFPVDFVRYNRRQTSRIYPKGARVDSSNYMPQVFWNAGCQFVALNFQVLDLAMQLNLGLFEFNGSTGYLLKPEHMRKKDRMFDPFAKNMDGVVASTLKIKIISGLFLSNTKLGTYVEVEMYGLTNDTYRKQFKTKTVDSNTLYPHYNSTEFTFKKIVLPSLAVLRVAMVDTGGNVIGQRFLKFDGLKPGYRYVTLRNEGNQPLTMPSLFVHLQVKDFVPPVHKELADWLANPIPYMKEKEREEKDRKDREKAINMLLGPEEIRRMDEANPYLPAMKPGSSATLPGKRGANRREAAATPSNRINGPSLSMPPGAGKEPNRAPREEKELQYFDPFDPQTLNDIKLSKPYEKLIKEQQEKLEKLRKKQRDVYNACYRRMYGSIRKQSFMGTLKSIMTRKPTTSEITIDTNPALPDEAKKEELIKLLCEHFLAERDFQLGEISSFIKKFEAVVKNHQAHELIKLEERSHKEQTKVQKQKNLEKDQKIKDIPSNLAKDEVEKIKSEINSTHIEECVRERTLLSSKQAERHKDVCCQQDDILNNLEEMKKEMQMRIGREYEENKKNAANLFETRKLEISARKSSSTISSFNDVKDGEYLTLL